MVDMIDLAEVFDINTRLPNSLINDRIIENLLRIIILQNRALDEIKDTFYYEDDEWDEVMSELPDDLAWLMTTLEVKNETST